MHSEVFLLCIVAILQTTQAVKTDVKTSSDDITKSSLDSENDSPSRTKRWAEMDTRSGYNRGYNPSNYYQRYMYPSNLMALLRGRRSYETSSTWESPSDLMTFPKGRNNYEPTGNWEVPSNLMTFLRGRRSNGPTGSVEMPSNLMTLLRGRRSYDNWRVPSNLMVLLRGKKLSDSDDDDDVVVDEAEVEDSDDVDSDDISSKRSLYLDYSPRLSGRYFRPYGARPFFVRQGGRSLIG